MFELQPTPVQCVGFRVKSLVFLVEGLGSTI